MIRELPRQPNQDEESEFSAEQAAMRKVVDIHTAPFYRHAFVRFGPVDVGMNPFRPQESEVNSTLDRLRQIFLHGLVSAEYARRNEIPFSRNYIDPDNVSYVSIAQRNPQPPYDSILYNFDFAIEAASDSVNGPLIPREHILVLLVAPVESYPSTIVPEFERLVKDRIDRSDFQDVVILDDLARNGPPNGIYCPEKVNWDSSTSTQTAQKVASEMLKVYENSHHLAIPIYGTSGDLYWPTFLPHEKVQDRIERRKQYE